MILRRTDVLTVGYYLGTYSVRKIRKFRGSIREYTQTDGCKGKKICLLTLPGGRHNYTKFFVFLDI